MPRCNASVVKRDYARDRKSCSCFSDSSPRSQDIRRKSQVPCMVWDYALGPELLSMASFSNCICKWLTFKSNCAGVAQVGSPTLSSPIGLASVPLSKGQCCWKAAFMSAQFSFLKVSLLNPNAMALTKPVNGIDITWIMIRAKLGSSETAFWILQGKENIIRETDHTPSDWALFKWLSENQYQIK